MDTAQSQRLVASLLTLLEQGTAPWRRGWDPATAGHHVNLRSGRRYQGINPILLTLGMHQRGSQLPFWCGWGEARALGLVPRAGSQAIHVLRPLPHRSRRPAQDNAPSRSAWRDEAHQRGWVSFSAMAVFNAADLVGEALPPLLERRAAKALRSVRPEPERLAAAEAVLQRWPVPVVHGSDRACYLPGGDRIVLPPRCSFHSAAAYYATWAHEAVHSTGHPSRLGRDLSGAPGSASEAREELVAELGSVLLGDRLEIGSDLANHAAYLASWIALLRDTPQVLWQVLAEARRAVDCLVPHAGVQPQQGEGIKSASR